jgi:hypothetical protein
MAYDESIMYSGGRVDTTIVGEMRPEQVYDKRIKRYFFKLLSIADFTKAIKYKEVQLRHTFLHDRVWGGTRDSKLGFGVCSLADMPKNSEFPSKKQ